MTEKNKTKAQLIKEIAELKQANERLQRKIAKRQLTADALLKSERFLNTIFNSIHDPFSIMDRDYRIVKVNEAYAQLKNTHTKDLLGKRCYEALRDRSSTCEDCVVVKTFKSGDPCAMDRPMEEFAGPKAGSKTGLKTWVEIYTYPIFDEEGAVSHVIEYTRDITDRKKAEQERGRLIENLKRLSRTDSLTGLLNRRALTDRLKQEFERVKRYGSPLSLVMCDVDYFKMTNDTYGHAVGDRVLRAVAETLGGSLRGADIVGRCGGDEFMLILPETPIDGAGNIAERIRLTVKNTRLELEDGGSVSLSVSLGVADYTPDMEDMDALIKRADTAMYRSKEAGKNRVHVIKL